MSDEDYVVHDRMKYVLVIAVVILVASSGFTAWQQTNAVNQMKDLSGKLNTTQGQVNELQRFLVVLLNQSGISIPPINGKFTLEAVYSTGNGPWSVVISGFNGQLRDETITKMTIDGANYTGLVSPDGVPFTVRANSSFLVSFIVSSGNGQDYSSGQVILVKLYSNSGDIFSEYIALSAGSGQLGGSLILSPSVNNGVLILLVSNNGVARIIVNTVLFDGSPVSPVMMQTLPAFVGMALDPSQTGSILFSPVGVKSGTTYPIAVSTTSGSFTTTVTWP